MARIEYGGGVTAITGSMGGSVFQRNGSGFIIRAKGTTRQSRTDNQRNQLALFQSMRNQWLLLSYQNRVDWQTFANDHPRTDQYGRTKFINGITWFSSITFMRMQMGEIFSPTPPTYELPSAVPSYYVDNDADNFYIHYDYGDFAATDVMHIQMSTAGYFTSANVRGSLRVIGFYVPAVGGVTDISEAYYNIFGVYPSELFGSGLQLLTSIKIVHANSGICSIQSNYICEL